MKLHQIGLVTDRTALTPAAIEIDGVIRIFAGFVYDDGMSRIHTIDVNPKDPSEVYAVSEEPVLDLGGPGRFDSHGQIPAHAEMDGEGFGKLWYSGFQQLKDVPFLLMTGLYTWSDRGYSVGHTHRSDVPELDREWKCPVVRAGYCPAEGISFYAGGSDFISINGKLHPRYAIYHTGWNGPVLIPKDREYRIGKPHVWRTDIYHILCTAYALPENRSYLVYAISRDSLHWERRPLEITGSVFPSPIYAYRCGEWVFFNGAGNGVGGVGYGRLED